MKPRRPWTDYEIAKARRMIASGMTGSDVDRALGRAARSTRSKLRLLDRPDCHDRAKANMRRRWHERAAQTGDGASA